MIGRHSERQGLHGPFRRVVRGTLLQARPATNGTGVHNRWMLRAAQVRQRGAAGSYDAEHVDLEQPQKVLIMTVFHGSARTDSRVIDQDIDSPEELGRLVD